jgi:hypothetical protein
MSFASRLSRARRFFALRPFTVRYASRASVSDSPSTVTPAARFRVPITTKWEDILQATKGDGWRYRLSESERTRLAAIEMHRENTIARLKKKNKDDWEAILFEAQRKTDARKKACLSRPEKITEIPADVKSKLLADVAERTSKDGQQKNEQYQGQVYKDRIYTVAVKMVMIEHGRDLDTVSKNDKQALQHEIYKKFSDLAAELGLENSRRNPRGRSGLPM